MGFLYKLILPLLLVAFILLKITHGFDRKASIADVVILAVLFVLIFTFIEYKYLQSISISEKEIILRYKLWNKIKERIIPIDPTTDVLVLEDARARYESRQYRLVIFQNEKIIFTQHYAGDWTREKFEEARVVFKARKR